MNTYENLDEELNEYFKQRSLKTIPVTKKEKLIILRNIASNCESALVDLEESYNKSERTDENSNKFVVRTRNLESEYLLARSYIIDLKSEIRKENINNFKSKVKSIFKK